MSTISAGLTVSTGLNWVSDTSGTLVLQSGGTANITVSNTAITVSSTGNLLLQSSGVTGVLLDTNSRLRFANIALTTAATGALEYDGRVLYQTPTGTQRGIVPGWQFYRLDAAFAGTTAITAQPFLGVGVTLTSATVYRFEALMPVSKTVTATAHTLSIGFGGNATINNISYEFYSTNSTSLSYIDLTNGTIFGGVIQTAAATSIASLGATAAIYKMIMLKGIVSINAGGTFIPQYTISAAVGPYSTAAGSYFAIHPIGAAGANTSVGTWA